MRPFSRCILTAGAGYGLSKPSIQPVRSLRAYFRFIAANAPFLGFGLLLACFSSFGQTFYIGLFGAPIRAEFALGHAEFGSLYMVGTLISGFAFAFAGRAIDRIALRHYAACALVGLAAACAVMASATGVVLLTAALCGLRFFGQGLVTHTAHTATARHFERNRGKALSIVMLGHPLGEALLPPIAVAAAAWLGWREVWWVASALLVLAILPSALLLLPQMPPPPRPAAAGVGAWSTLFGDRRFLLALPAVLAPAFVSTGFAFHIAPLAVEQGWGMGLVAAAFTAFAIAKVAMSLAAGPAIDRFGARAMLPALLLPLMAACLALSAGTAVWIAFLFMALLGVSGGLTQTLLGAIWAEVYGVGQLGAIRSVYFVLMVFSSALAPAAFGRAMDAGVGLAGIGLACAAVIAGAKLLLLASGLNRR